MGKRFTILLLCFTFFIPIFCQTDSTKVGDALASSSNFSGSNPSSAIKSNLLFATIGTINLGAEFKIKGLYTIDASAGINPLKLGNKRLQFYYLQTEIRKWREEIFEGDFWGVQGIYAGYNIGGWKLPIGLDNLKNSRYDGYMLGVGVDYGRTWIIGDRWRFEATVGGGFMLHNYSRYDNMGEGKLIESKTKQLPMLPKIGVSIVYILQPIKKYRFINAK